MKHLHCLLALCLCAAFTTTYAQPYPAKTVRIVVPCTEHHDNCADNLRAALAPHRVPLPCVPTPLNLFMNTKFDDHRVMRIEPPEARAGDSVTFRAEHDCIVAMSACPQDLVPVNGHGCTPKPVGYVVTIDESYVIDDTD
jgi:uncharacterized protein YcgI (DUF1989 family)